MVARVAKPYYDSAYNMYSLCKFGLREVRYINYRYEVVGEVAICFYLILLKRHRILSRIHVFVGVFLIS